MYDKFKIILLKLQSYLAGDSELDILLAKILSCLLWQPLSSFAKKKTLPVRDVKFLTLQWRHNEHDGVSNHQHHDCLLSRLFGHKSKKTSKLRVTGLCEGNSPVTGEYPAERACNSNNVSILWRHHVALFAVSLKMLQLH